MVTFDRRTRGLRALAAAAALAVLPVANASAADVYTYWILDDGTDYIDGNYANPNGWSTGVVPFYDTADRHRPYINTGRVVTLDTPDHTAYFVYLNQTSSGAPAPTPGSTLRVAPGGSLTATYLRPGGGSTVSVEGGQLSATSITVGYTAGTATLDVSAGSLSGSTAVGESGSGILNITGTGVVNGSLSVNNGANTGIVNLDGGTLAATSVSIGTGGSGTGTFNLIDGDASLSSRLRVGSTSQGALYVSGGTLNANAYETFLGGQNNTNGIGLLEISGGTTSMSKGMIVGGTDGNGGAGTLRMVGAEGDLSLSGVGLDVFPNSALEFVIGTDGVSTIMVHESAASSSTSGSLLAGTLDIDLMGGFAPTVGDTFDLISTGSTYTGATGGTFVDGYDITNLTLAPEDQAYWSYAVVNEESRNILRLTNIAPIPEPAGLALLGLALPALLRRRRA